MTYPSAVPAVFLKRSAEKESCFFLAISPGSPILPLAHPRAHAPMTSLLDTAASIHTKHLSAAQRAMDAVPPRLDLFWLHSRICDSVSQTLDDLRPKQATSAPVPADDNTEAQPPQQ